MSEPTMTPADETGRNSHTDRVLWQPLLSPGINVQEVDGQVIMLDKENQQVHQLDRIGTKILYCCDGTHTVPNIVAELAKEFDVSQVKLGADVAMLLKKMRGLGLLI